MQGDECYHCHQIGHWSCYCPLKSPNNKSDLVKRMQSDECFHCHKIGHWSSNCPSKSPNNKPDLEKRMQGDECFHCHKIGHWSWYCPLKSPNNKPNKPDLVKRMQGDECFCCHQIGHWSWYCPSKSPNSKPDLVKRMQGDECFHCHQIGHWSCYCPSKSTNHKPLSLSPKINSPLSPEMIFCRCGHGFCEVKTSLTDRKYYACPIKRGAKCKEFVKWCNDPINESDLQPPLLKYPECVCGAGVCRRVKKETTQNSNGAKYYFECPVKKGQGSCGYRVSEDELLNNNSIVPIRQSRHNTDLGNDLGEGSDLLVQIERMRIKDNSNNTSSMIVSKISGEEAGGSAIKATNSKHVSFPGFEVADDDLEFTTFVTWEAIKAGAFPLSCLSAHSRIRHQSAFQRLIFIDASLVAASCSMGWLGRLLFFHPTRSLKFPPPQPFFCCVFPSFNRIVVPKQATILNGPCEYKDLANKDLAINNIRQHTQLSTCCHAEVSRDVVSPNKSPDNETKPMSKAQRYREVVLFTQEGLLNDPKTSDPHQRLSKRKKCMSRWKFSVLWRKLINSLRKRK